MSLKNTVGTLAQGAVTTAVSVVRHPLSTASMAAGLVKGTAGVSVDLARAVVRGPGQVEDRVQEKVEDHLEGNVEGQVDVPTQRDGADGGQDAAAQSAPSEVLDVPREPEVVPKPVPEIDELPEPVVIEADDSPGEAFHTEPKAASRDSEHGGSPGDREEATGYVEEIPSDIADAPSEDTLVWSSETDAPEATAGPLTPESTTPAPEPAEQNRPI
jgi:hypothetical protein